jgi:hypothetical protein
MVTRPGATPASFQAYSPCSSWRPTLSRRMPAKGSAGVAAASAVGRATGCGAATVRAWGGGVEEAEASSLVACQPTAPIAKATDSRTAIPAQAGIGLPASVGWGSVMEFAMTQCRAADQRAIPAVPGRDGGEA